jgi:hypothetical protein
MAVSTEEEMREYRREHFAARIETPRDGMSLFDGEKVLRITHNGRQDVAVVSMAPHEARVVYDLLRAGFGFQV